MRTRKNYIHKKPTNLSIFEESLIHQKEKSEEKTEFQQYGLYNRKELLTKNKLEI